MKHWETLQSKAVEKHHMVLVYGASALEENLLR